MFLARKWLRIDFEEKYVFLVRKNEIEEAEVVEIGSYDKGVFQVDIETELALETLSSPNVEETFDILVDLLACVEKGIVRGGDNLLGMILVFKSPILWQDRGACAELTTVPAEVDEGFRKDMLVDNLTELCWEVEEAEDLRNWLGDSVSSQVPPNLPCRS